MLYNTMSAYYRVLHIKYESVAESPNGNQGEPFSLPLLVGFISCTCTLIGQARGTLYIKHIHFHGLLCTLIGQARGTLYIKHIHFHGLLWLLREFSSIQFRFTYYYNVKLKLKAFLLFTKLLGQCRPSIH